MNQPIFVQVNPGHTVATISIPLAGNGENAASAQALQTLRNDVIPATIDKVPGTKTGVTGYTAGT